MKLSKLALGVAVASLASSSFAFAGQPERPGAFGRDRAANIKNFQADQTSPGASEWGKIAAERGSTNGDLNRAYKQSSGGAPTKGKPAK